MSSTPYIAHRLQLVNAIPRGWGMVWDATPNVRIRTPGGKAADLTPDEARELGIALVEASGLAMGAWGRAQQARAEDLAADSQMEGGGA